jgi:hypothetical protein
MLRTSIQRRAVIQRQHAVRDAVQLQVRAFGGAVIKQQNGAVAAEEEVLHGQDLAPVAQRVLRHQAQLGQRIEHHALRAGALHDLEHLARRLGQLHLRRVVHRDLLFAAKLLLVGHQLGELDAVERPTVRGGACGQLFTRLRQRDVEAALTGARTSQQVLQRHRRLAGARVAFDQIDAPGDVAAVQNLVQAGHAGGRPIRI